MESTLSNSFAPGSDIEKSAVSNETFYRDSTRDAVLHVFCETIGKLVSGKLEGKNRYNKLLLGRKAVGKTTMLDVTERACLDVLGKRVHVLRLDASSQKDHARLSGAHGLVGAMASEVGILTDHKNLWLEDVTSALDTSGRHMIILFDEFDLVYTGRFEREAGQRIIGDIFELAGNTSGRYFVVVSGSSKYLRRLCFAKVSKLPASVMDSFPNYMAGVDLNSTKLQPIWIEPLVNAEDYLTYVRRMCPKLLGSPDLLLQDYFRSGGLPGLIGGDELSDSWSVGAKGEAGSEILRKLLDLVGGDWCVASDLEDDEDDQQRTGVVRVEGMARCTKFVYMRLTDDPGDLYDLADSGIIRVRPGNMVSFASCVAYYDCLRARDSEAITAAEAGDLRGNSPLAEGIAMRALCVRSKAWLGSPLNLPDVAVLPAAVANGSAAGLLGKRMFKCLDAKGRDSLGSDGVIFWPPEIPGRDGWKIHCIQLKLWSKKEFPQEDLERVFANWKQGEARKTEEYQTRFPDVSAITYVYHLVCTCPVRPEWFQDLVSQYHLNAKLHGKKFLAEHVWLAGMSSAHSKFGK
jgi:hypothetical protein